MRSKQKVIRNCKQCGQEFECFIWSKKEFCRKECYYDLIRKQRVTKYCASCGNDIKATKYRRTRNDEYYCNVICYNNRRKEDLKRIKRHTGYFAHLVEEGCSCGIKEYYLLQIHHKDGNPNNNNPSNHEVVCANCHIKRHLKLNGKGKLVYHTKTLTPEEISRSLIQ